ncbi:hypothetical protein EYF80_018082 [Liparis tanakae]|uniref:Uncharacterized protein n=1 Tax=Liparis tanakae TaxID=230148 RepID=A0A4Z2I1P2_9TELE|nr:hypothetical protein EYF80_018082 [Liparis tanakae]
MARRIQLKPKPTGRSTCQPNAKCADDLATASGSLQHIIARLLQRQLIGGAPPSGRETPALGSHQEFTVFSQSMKCTSVQKE